MATNTHKMSVSEVGNMKCNTSIIEDYEISSLYIDLVLIFFAFIFFSLGKAERNIILLQYILGRF